MTTAGQCAELNNCNAPHGRCINSACQCEPGYQGVDCGSRVTTIAVDTVYTGSVALEQWNYYALTIASKQDLLVTVTQTTEGDSDIYTKTGKLPTKYDFDLRNLTTDPTYILVIPEPDLGILYIGIFGYTACSYSFKVTSKTDCQTTHKCSLHGTCLSGDRCNCNRDFSGATCQNMIPALTVNVPVNGFVDEDAWNYYHVQALVSSALKVTVSQTSAQDDCDLYIRSGQNPDEINYDYRDVSVDQVFSIEIPNPGDRIWYFGVLGYSKCTYSIKFEIASGCPYNCNGHGSCQSGTCVCTAGWAGDSCNSSAPILTNQATRGNNQVAVGNWDFYRVTTPLNASYVSISVRETETTGYLWVFVSRARSPNERFYDYTDKFTFNRLSAFHHIEFTMVPGLQETWYVGVLGNPYGGNLPTKYSINPWVAPF